MTDHFKSISVTWVITNIILLLNLLLNPFLSQEYIFTEKYVVKYALYILEIQGQFTKNFGSIQQLSINNQEHLVTVLTFRGRCRFNFKKKGNIILNRISFLTFQTNKEMRKRNKIEAICEYHNNREKGREKGRGGEQ